jgi:ankyrin repeat protein
MVMAGLDVNQGCKKENVMPICRAAGYGHYEVVQYLIDCGADLSISTSVENPLFWAVTDWKNAVDTQIVKALLIAGIDTTAKYSYKSKTKNKKDLDAMAKAFLYGTPVKAGVIAAWNAKESNIEVDAILNEAMNTADSHLPSYKYGEKKAKENEQIRERSLRKAIEIALSTNF